MIKRVTPRQMSALTAATIFGMASLAAAGLIHTWTGAGDGGSLDDAGNWD